MASSSYVASETQRSCFFPPDFDWDAIHIEERYDEEEGSMNDISEDQLYELLGLQDQHVGNNRDVTFDDIGIADDNVDSDGAAIPVNDCIPEELVIAYEKDHPKMELRLMYPSMKDFRLVVRQFANNEEFELGTEKSDKKRFRGFCKGEGCPWRIVGNRQDDERTIKVH